MQNFHILQLLEQPFAQTTSEIKDYVYFLFPPSLLLQFFFTHPVAMDVQVTLFAIYCR